jgi:hypothetical protein
MQLEVASNKGDFLVHPANAYLDNLPAMKGIAKRHSREACPRSV